MNLLEQEIIQKFNQLDADAQQRVLQQISIVIESGDPSFDFDEWLASVHELQAAIRERIGEDATVGALDLLNELREES